MPEINPDNLEVNKPLTPEQIEAIKAQQAHKEKLEAAGEFLNAHETRQNQSFQTEAERSALSHQLKTEILESMKKQPHDEQLMDAETGLHAREAEKLKKDPM